MSGPNKALHNTLISIPKLNYGNNIIKWFPVLWPHSNPVKPNYYYSNREDWDKTVMYKQNIKTQNISSVVFLPIREDAVIVTWQCDGNLIFNYRVLKTCQYPDHLHCSLRAPCQNTLSLNTGCRKVTPDSKKKCLLLGLIWYDSYVFYCNILTVSQPMRLLINDLNHHIGRAPTSYVWTWCPEANVANMLDTSWTLAGHGSSHGLVVTNKWLTCINQHHLPEQEQKKK